MSGDSRVTSMAPLGPIHRILNTSMMNSPVATLSSLAKTWEENNARLRALFNPLLASATLPALDSLPITSFVEMRTQGTSRFHNAELGVNPNSWKPSFVNTTEIIFRLRQSARGKWKDFEIHQVTAEMARERIFSNGVNSWQLSKISNKLVEDAPDPGLQAAEPVGNVSEVAFYDAPGPQYNDKDRVINLGSGAWSTDHGNMLLVQQNFLCWVEARPNAGGSLRRISPVFPWHSRQCLGFDEHANKWVPYHLSFQQPGEGPGTFFFNSHIGPGLDV
ncbi:hypothetical protein BLGI_4843 [Brevibacillus laterosporus GI-9]|uniref:hypothetical protein n=1 Tax=Brevibacillus laterosporus TaxID=1465 RepID=UPI00024054A3|nr:hypothetical protein [Brevibacillus laterosporus]CCF16874.1 hypothetical protein BLGI_4843 [Brevibacillus laterosporus GI-9]